MARAGGQLHGTHACFTCSCKFPSEWPTWLGEIIYSCIKPESSEALSSACKDFTALAMVPCFGVRVQASAGASAALDFSFRPKSRDILEER
jgi:hypothetical protein